MKPAKQLMEKVNRGDVVLGTLAMNQIWMGMVELHMQAGLDYLIIDMEHGAHDESLVVELCALGRMVGYPVLVRPIDLEMSTIRRVMDMGACGMLLPTVESAADLDKVRDAIYVPPRGQRRAGGRGNGWVSKNSLENYQQEVEADLIILPQIETQAGLANATEIAGHEITSALAHGPNDFSYDIGIGGQGGGERVAEATAQMRDAAHAVGKKMWVIGDGPTLRQRGYTFICIGIPMGILRGAFARIVSETNAANS